MPWALALFACLLVANPIQGQVPDDAESEQEETVEPGAMRHPLVRSLLESQSSPPSPAELLRAAIVTADLGFPNLSRRFMRDLLDQEADDQTLAALLRERGTAALVRLSRNEALLPEAQDLLDRALSAMELVNRDPARLDALIAQLGDASPRARAQAVADLQLASDDAAVALVAALGDAALSAIHPQIRDVLLRLGRTTAARPIIAALESPDATLSVQLLDLLGRLGGRDARLYLYAPALSSDSPPGIRRAAQAALSRLGVNVPTREAAADQLVRRAVDEISAQRRTPAGRGDLVETWQWNDEERRVVRVAREPDEAHGVTAARLATEAWAIARDDPVVERLYVSTRLAAITVENQSDRAALVVALGADGEKISGVLAWAMEVGHLAGARAAARLLGEIGSAGQLTDTAPGLSPLAVALRHPDARLRVDAVEAIMNIGPRTPYPGSSFVTESLAHFVAAGGSSTVIVAAPRAEQALHLAGMLAQDGYNVEIATTGRGLLRLATSLPDCVLMLVSINLSRPGPLHVLSQLRRNARTAALPVGWTADVDDLPRAERLARNDGLSLALAQAAQSDDLSWQVERLLELAGPPETTPQERLEQARRSLAHLAEVAAEPALRQLYDLQRAEEAVTRALDRPPLTEPAALVLGRMRSPKAQRALVQLASRETRPTEHRQQAARAFAASLRRFGVLLTSREILRQYDRYNGSKFKDVSTQEILASILDAIESQATTESPAESGSVSSSASGGGQ